MKYLVLLGLMHLVGCVSSSDKKIELNESPEDDKVYFKALEKATRSADVYHNFETEYKVKATLFSADFKAALRERHKNILLLDSSAFEETSNKLGFLISIFAPETSTIELDNKSHWTIVSSSGNSQNLKPIMLRKIDDKTRWKNYFHYINKWTHEWLVVFDAPTVQSPSEQQLVEAQKTTLTLATGTAKMTLNW